MNKDYRQGTTVECSCRFTDADSGATVPAEEVTLTVQKPDGTLTTQTLTGTQIELHEGRYRGFVDTDQAGLWKFEFDVEDLSGERNVTKRSWFRVKPRLA